MKELVEISTALECWNYLKRAILTTRINNLKSIGKEIPITSANALVGQTLAITNEKYISLLDDLSDYLKVIDQECSNRFGWDELRSKISESYISIFNSANLESFLAQEKYHPTFSE